MIRFEVVCPHKETGELLNIFKNNATFKSRTSAKRSINQRQTYFSDNLSIREVEVFNDTERLEWLIKTFNSVLCFPDKRCYWVVDQSGDVVSELAKTPREAIDAAMKET